MRPTREQIANILKRLKEWRKMDESLQESYNKFNEVFAPNSYSPIIEVGGVDAFIEGVCMVYPELGEDLSYFIYDAQNMDSPICTVNGKKYNAKDIGEFTDFIMTINQYEKEKKE